MIGQLIVSQASCKGKIRAGPVECGRIPEIESRFAGQMIFQRVAYRLSGGDDSAGPSMILSPVNCRNPGQLRLSRPELLDGPMRLVRISQPLRFAACGIKKPTLPLIWRHRPGLPQLRVEAPNAAVVGQRHASTKSQGVYRVKSKKTNMKKMGCKKTGGMQLSQPLGRGIKRLSSSP